MNKQELESVIPHRNSMLLIDEATKTSETTCEGKKYITGKEWFLDGHFPGNPVVPGVILCEMMAQASSVIIAEVSAASIPFFTSIEKAKFKNKVLPGDTFEIKCELTRNRGVFYFVSAKGSVNGKICASADFSFALIPKDKVAAEM
ncbi:MAG: 3-hydroxyacyl-ACP dehydratase FabZ [Clostridia bacterium]|jgi:3-hydroxyacyl-[acyl-carrier-protein] dehydratase|nr:3-hydroxyacyl-ACP dehydratase FabZ [Clostridia bacterium]